MSGPDPWTGQSTDWGPIAVYTATGRVGHGDPQSGDGGSGDGRPGDGRPGDGGSGDRGFGDDRFSDDGLGVPGRFGQGEQWSSVTYSGPRRHRPRQTVVPPPAAAVSDDPALLDVAPAADLADDPAGGRHSTAAPVSSDTAGHSSESSGHSSLLRSSRTESPAGVPRTSESPGHSSLLRSSRTMAVASLASRITGFLRSVALAAALGVAASRVADSYNIANVLPNMVYELLLGGVLSSVVIPLIVSSQEHDADGGEAYTRRLLSWAVVALGIATLLAVAAAPLLAAAFASEAAQRSLISIFATLLLPEIFFYGLGAMFTAVLNTRSVYGPPAWAPVLNNVITIATVGVFAVLPGPKLLTESTITTTQVLVLGIGTTLGIAAQALVLIPSLRRVGFRFGWQFRATAGQTVHMSEVRTLGLWVLGYVAVSQVGVFVVNRVANQHQGGPTTFAYADLLFQVPYGIIGVSLLTALMPRMSRSAARGDDPAVLADLSLGARLSAVGLVPISIGLMVLGPSLTTVLFFYGRTNLSDARHIGIVLALGAFGLLPFAIVMLQLRVFYAMRDARTPTLINVFMIVTKVAIVLLAAVFLRDRQVIEALSVATSLSYLVGAVVGYVLLRRRFGSLGFGQVGVTIARVLGCSLVGALAALGVVQLAGHLIGTGRGAAAIAVIGGSVLGGAIAVVVMRLVRVPEVEDILAVARGRS